MKNFLAVDTSGSYLTVLAVKDGNAFSCYLPECAMKQSVLLMNAVDETLQKANMTLGDCDFFRGGRRRRLVHGDSYRHFRCQGLLCGDGKTRPAYHLF